MWWTVFRENTFSRKCTFLRVISVVVVVLVLVLVVVLLLLLLRRRRLVYVSILHPLCSETIAPIDSK